MFEAEQKAIETSIRAFCRENQLPEPEQIPWAWIPFSGHWGISTSFFQIAAQEARRGKPVQVPARAQELAQAAAAALGTPPGFERVEAVRGYLNLYFHTPEYSRRVADAVLAQGADYGRGAPKNEQVMVEFSQPNTHKAFHVGHLRSAILGDVLARILDFAGFETVRANYPGDMGLHVIKWLWNYMDRHAGERPESDITSWMGKLYAEASKRLEENPALEAEVRALYARWDRRDPEVVALWEETREWSLQGFRAMYATLGILGDYFADRGRPMVKTDLGRFNVTGREEDRHMFKVPTLRNVARTAPYFHDGGIDTLEKAVDTMARYQLGRDLDAADRQALVAFLHALNGRLPKIDP